MSFESTTEEDSISSIDDERYIGLKLTIFAILMVVLCLIAAFLIRRRLQHPYVHPVIISRRKSEFPA